MSKEAIQYLNDLPNASEAVQITHYSVYINGRPLNVTVSDMGEGAGSVRYTARAEWAAHDPEDSPFPEYSQGNPGWTLHEALENIHWWKFKND